MEKKLITIAQIVSIIFTPFYIPLLALILLFIFIFNNYDMMVKINIVCAVYFMTILLPTVLIYYYRKYDKWHRFVKERRMVPYIIAIVCYFSCFYILSYYKIPYCFTSIIITALLIQLACALINIWWKISTHMAGIGAFTGGLVVFSLRFSYNALLWLCIALLVAGIVGTSRMILRQHKLSQIYIGYLLGLVISSYYLGTISIF